MVEKRRAFIINAVYYLIFAVCAYLLIKYALPLLTPFVVGFAVAYILRRPIRALSRGAKLNRKLCAVIVAALFYVLLGGLITLLVIKTGSGIKSIIEMVPTLYESMIKPLLLDVFATAEQIALRLDPSVFELINDWGNQILKSLGEQAYSISMWVMRLTSTAAASLPALFINVLLSIISTFFIAIDYDKFIGFFKRQLKGKAVELAGEIKQYLIGTLFVCIRSYIIIMSITFVELAIGLSLLRVRHSVLIAACIAVFDILPVLGTGGILAPWAVINLVTGRYTMAFGILALYLFVTVVRNIIEPKIVGGQLGLHPIVTLASMITGARLLGVIGLFGFPIGLSLLMYLNGNGTIKLFNMEKAQTE